MEKEVDFSSKPILTATSNTTVEQGEPEQVSLEGLVKKLGELQEKIKSAAPPKQRIKIVIQAGNFSGDTIMAIVVLVAAFRRGVLDITMLVSPADLPTYLADKDCFVINCGGDFNPDFNNFDCRKMSNSGGAAYKVFGKLQSMIVEDDVAYEIEQWLYDTFASNRTGSVLSAIEALNHTDPFQTDKQNDCLDGAIKLADLVFTNLVYDAKQSVLIEKMREELKFTQSGVPYFEYFPAYLKLGYDKFIMHVGSGNGWVYFTFTDGYPKIAPCKTLQDAKELADSTSVINSFC